MLSVPVVVTAPSLVCTPVHRWFSFSPNVHVIPWLTALTQLSVHIYFLFKSFQNKYFIFTYQILSTSGISTTPWIVQDLNMAIKLLMETAWVWKTSQVWLIMRGYRGLSQRCQKAPRRLVRRHDIQAHVTSSLQGKCWIMIGRRNSKMADTLLTIEWKHLQIAIVFCVSIPFILQRTVMETQLVMWQRHDQFTRLSLAAVITMKGSSVCIFQQECLS